MLATILYLVLGLLVALAVIGWLLPREITVERTISVDRPSGAIFPWIANLKTWPDWTIWNKNEDPSLAYTYSGADSGLGATMSWTAKKMGDGALTINAAQSGRLCGRRRYVMGTFGPLHWLLLIAVILILFGGRGKISDLMGDFAKGIKSFKKGMSDEDQQPPPPPRTLPPEQRDDSRTTNKDTVPH